MLLELRAARAQDRQRGPSARDPADRLRPAPAGRALGLAQLVVALGQPRELKSRLEEPKNRMLDDD